MSKGDTTVVRSGGVGFFGLLTLIFVVAKLAGWITWSWWVVFSPLLVSFGLVMLTLLLFVVGYLWVMSKS